MQNESEKLGILISTYGEGMHSVISTVLPTINFTKAIVVINHQKSDRYNGVIPESDSIIYQKSESIGLSRSRNECLRLTPCEVNVIADDDISYAGSFEGTVLKSFEKIGADIITFQTVEGAPRVTQTVEHNWLSLLRVKSIEVAFKKSTINESGIFFDEQFGLKARHKTGEENIFLEDSRKAGLQIYDSPERIVSHPHKTSGENLDRVMMKAKRKVFIRMFGLLKGTFLYYIFYIKKSFS